MDRLLAQRSVDPRRQSKRRELPEALGALRLNGQRVGEPQPLVLGGGRRVVGQEVRAAQPGLAHEGTVPFPPASRVGAYGFGARGWRARSGRCRSRRRATCLQRRLTRRYCAWWLDAMATITREEALSVLKWAAGAPIDPPTLPVDVSTTGDEEGHLLQLVLGHRLGPRFVGRCLRARPHWCGRQLLAGSIADFERSRRHHVKQLEAMLEISHAMGAGAQQPVTIKGYATYAVTGDPFHIHYSGDLDLFAQDEGRLEQILAGLGYEPMGAPAPHEYAELRRGEVAIEPHRHFPVWRYPAQVAAGDLAGARHPGCWFQDFPPPLEQRIMFSDVRAHARHGMAPGTEALLVPSPAMSVLILCAHEFWAALRFEYAGVPIRLGAIADVYDLCRSPAFDSEELASLSQKFHAQDCLGFAAHLLEAVYGHSPLSVNSPNRARHVEDGFPAMLHPQAAAAVHPQGCWAAFYSGDDYLIPINMGDAIAHRLGLNTVCVPSSGEPATVRVGQARRNANRLVVQSPSRRVVPVEMGVRWTDAHLEFDVRVMRPPLSENETVKLSFGVYDDGFMRYWATLADQGRRLVENRQGCALLVPYTEGYRIRVRWPWSLLRAVVRC